MARGRPVILAEIFQYAEVAAAASYIAGAIAAATVGAWIALRRDRFGAAAPALVVALILSAGWCISVITFGGEALIAGVAETLRNLAWLTVLYRLFATDGRHASLAPIKPVLVVLALVEVARIAAEILLERLAGADRIMIVTLDKTLVLHLLVAVGGLMLVHNLYVGASRQAQAVLRWPATGLAVIWAVDLNFYTLAYLTAGWPHDFALVRGLAVLALAGLIAIGGLTGNTALRFRPSRAVTFQTFSLMVIGGYLIAMVAIAQWLAYAGGNFARMMELAFLTMASVLAILVLPSRRLRGWFRVIIAKHLFQHRYDYREEWLRFTRTVGNSGVSASPLGERVIQAVADIAESPAGLLLTQGDNGDLELAARWQWPAADVPAQALSQDGMAFLERGSFIVDLDDVRDGKAAHGEADVIPGWLREETRAWALIPLIHYERLVGVVVLARPTAARKFDWEDFDLLRVVGQQLASYLAENAGQEALAEASRFDDFSRRIAFVMHDIKNLASQLSLLARNAEKHAEKPEFRADMLVTLRNSTEKLNALIARLSRYGGGIDQFGEVDAADVARSVVGQFKGGHPVLLTECNASTVVANRESLEQVLLHLIQNGIDASAKGNPVFLSLVVENLNARFDVVDSGTGMSPEFVRTKLFKPFVSSKQGGFGIGAYEARELVRAMRGRLDVESREGLGSRFTVRLPLVAASDLYNNLNANNQRLAS
jgi:putative PEP-CTERM system histidine kinase